MAVSLGRMLVSGGVIALPVMFGCGAMRLGSGFV